jgi:hypothetical protein
LLSRQRRDKVAQREKLNSLEVLLARGVDEDWYSQIFSFFGQFTCGFSENPFADFS